MRVNWKKILLVGSDVVLGTYIVVAMTAFNKPDGEDITCKQVDINIQDEAVNGFISPKEIKNRLMKNDLYPLKKSFKEIDTREMEGKLRQSPFIKNVQCYKTQDGHVWITLTQRMPTLHIMANNGDDYYLDDDHRIMPNSHYTSNLIIASGHIDRWFARNYISFLADAIMANEYWQNQVVQINVLPDGGVELIARVGDNIIYLGQLPQTKLIAQRKQLVTDFANHKMDELEKFYKYGLSQAGWNKYSYINVEFDNQIICKKKRKE